jgi:hypothetical protein
MEPPSMILPKGIVLNIDRVYKEVASYSVVPPEKIYEYWHGIEITAIHLLASSPELIEPQFILQLSSN